MRTWSVRSPACNRKLVGRRSPTRHPDGCVHRSSDAVAHANSQRYAAAAISWSSVGAAAEKSRDPAVQQAGVEPAGGHVGIGQREAQEVDVGHHAEHGGVARARSSRRSADGAVAPRAR